MPTPDGPSSDQALPKLTLSQRVLAALPSLQRPAPAPAKAAPAKPLVRSSGTGTGSATGDDHVVRPDAVIESTGASKTSTARRTASDAFAHMSVPELRDAMKYLDGRERLFPLVIGPLLAVLDLVLTAVAIHSNPALGHKNHVAPSSIVALGVGSAIVALLVLVAAFYRRRSFTIFALLFAGYGGGFVTMIPSWFVAGWLFIRFNRMQKAVVARTGSPAARQRPARQSSARQGAGRAANGKPARSLFSRKDKTPEPTGPPPNKRYTPPKPATGGR